jgi:lactate dehydrogenase-like 2-hydroxyacid dehydrogenase
MFLVPSMMQRQTPTFSSSSVHCAISIAAFSTFNRASFEECLHPLWGHDPQGKLLGILGMGAIGRGLKRKVEALGITVQYHNRSKHSEELRGGAKYVRFEELLSTSDIISFNLPLNVSFFFHA